MIAAVLEHEPAPLPANAEEITPPALDAIIRTCLAKNPEDRWSSGHDLSLTLRRLEPAGQPPVPMPSKSQSYRAATLWLIAGMSLATMVAAVYRLSSPPPAAVAAPALQSSIEFPNAWLVYPMLSPDGRYLSLYSFSGVGEDGRLILLRRLVRQSNRSECTAQLLGAFDGSLQ